MSAASADAGLVGAALEAAAGAGPHREPPGPATARILAHLRAGASVADTADALGYQPRRLHRRCLDDFGYGPKTLARILRMQRAVDLARAGTPYASVAAESGYADQAHLSREVKALCGVPLRVLLR